MISVPFVIWVGIWIIVFLVIFIIFWAKLNYKDKAEPFIFKKNPKEELMQCPYCLAVFKRGQEEPLRCPNCNSYL